MSTNDIHAQLEEERRVIAGATGGPWAPWLDQDGAEHMNGMLMVGNAAAVIPDGDTWIEGVDVNPVAHCYTPEDRTFITHARTALPVRNAQVEAVLALHQPHWDDLPWRRRQPDIPGCTECYDEGRPFQYPCPTVRAIDGAGK